MKWLSALILTGLLTMGCRSSQPATNPFLRTADPAVVAAAEAWAGRPLSDDVAVFAALREWKNGFG